MTDENRKVPDEIIRKILKLVGYIIPKKERKISSDIREITHKFY